MKTPLLEQDESALIPERSRSIGTVLERLDSRTYYAVLVTLMGLAAALRLWDIRTRPGYQWDEPAYTYIARNVALHGSLTLKPQYNQAAAPFLFHPPIYFVVLAGWFRLFGAGLTQARVWAAMMSVVVLVILFVLLKRLIGRFALIATTVIAFDSWFIFSNRIGWIENTLLIPVVATIWLYHRALSNPSTRRFVLAGASLTLAIMVKFTGLYLLPTVLLNWLILRKHNREHRIMLLVPLCVGLVFIGILVVAYQRHGVNYFLSDSYDQVRRTFGFKSSAGNISSLNDYVTPLIHQYRVFAGTVLATILSAIVVAVRSVQCLQARSWQPVRANSLAFSWVVAAFVGFGAIDLKFPSYFELILIPAYVWLFTEGVAAIGRRDNRSRHATADRAASGRSPGGSPRGPEGALARVGQAITKRPFPALGCLLAVVLGLCGFYWRIAGRQDNALEEVRQFATAHIPASAVVVTVDSVGTAIPQQYCTYDRDLVCAAVASYVVTYVSPTQALPKGDVVLNWLLGHSEREKVIHGFSETITIWRVG